MNLRTRRIHLQAIAALTLMAAVLGGCGTSYVTPGRGADLTAFGLAPDAQRLLADGGVKAMLDRKPAAVCAV